MAKLEQIKPLITRYMGVDPDECTEDTYVDQLEALIEKANEYARNGDELFPDAIYDTLIDYLRELSPDSPVLHQVWSGDDATVKFDAEIDAQLVKHPMLSIRTIKDIDDPLVTDFINKVPDDNTGIHFSMKENGHGIRVCLVDGVVVKATSRGRSTNGRDLTKQVQLIVGNSVEKLKGTGLIELRGEVLLPFSNLDKAKAYNPNIKSAFSGVSSMLRDSATEEETKLLKFVAYDVLSDSLVFKTLDDKYKWLAAAGFEVPLASVVTFKKAEFKDNIMKMLEVFANNTVKYDYYTDGVVMSINDLELFNTFGAEDKFRYGNLALKIGRWEQNVYCGRVREIKWKAGKSKLSPVCVVEDPNSGELGVLTGTGNSVKNVPMYAPCYLLTLQAYPGNLIYFKYGGEAGVVPCTESGILVTDKAGMKMQNGSDDEDEE